MYQKILQMNQNEILKSIQVTHRKAEERKEKDTEIEHKK